ncbi:MAG: PhzF family phenazine biosynthesis protein [Planctomycetes bacterium]|nr:PhzF family phenazine biosynthesis protein [Planctomycetota bacterium]
MQLPIFQVDAFTSRLFRGNPAAVCPLEHWLPDETLQAIAAENNLSETAFFVGRDGRYHLRWFTPAVEVDLCGHATLASAFVVFEHLSPDLQVVRFDTRSGPLSVERRDGRLRMDFPSRPAAPCEAPSELLTGLGLQPTAVLRSRDYLVVYESEEQVCAIRPDFAALEKLPALGVIATAAGRSSDFVSRFFAPAAGIPEDPVTGSAHCTLTPYWAERLGRQSLHALQVSRRGGELWCELAADRVLIAGNAVEYLRGTIRVDELPERRG